MSYPYIVVFTGNIFSFAAGTALTWPSPELDILKNDTTIQMTDEQGSWVSSLFHLGAALGPFFYGFLVDRIGRKYTILSLGIPFTIGYVLIATVKELAVFYVVRFIMGFIVGGLFILMPIYVGEIADSSNRGTLISYTNVFFCAGMLFTDIVGPYLSLLVFNFILAIFPVTFVVFFYFIAVESPYHLLKNERKDEARKVLQKLRGSHTNIDKELAAIENAIEEETTGSFADIFKSKGNIKALIISVGLMVFQQFTGINAVLSFSQTIFKNAKSSLKPEICSMIIGAVQWGASFITPLLVDRLGRKMLLLLSTVGMTLSEMPLGIYTYLQDHNHDLSSISFLPIVCLVVFILSFCPGIGPVAWTVSSEMFPNEVKFKANTLVSFVSWFLAFLIVKYFESISNKIGMGISFEIFAGCCALATIFVQFFVIETAGKSLDEIQKELNK